LLQLDGTLHNAAGSLRKRWIATVLSNQVLRTDEPVVGLL
jgi:hypothetical protein